MSHSKEDDDSQVSPDEYPPTQEYIEAPDDSQKTPVISKEEERAIFVPLVPHVSHDIAKYILTFVEVLNSEYPRHIYVLAKCSKAHYDYYKDLLIGARRDVLEIIIKEHDNVPMPVNELFRCFAERFNAPEKWTNDIAYFHLYLKEEQFFDIRKPKNFKSYFAYHLNWSVLQKGFNLLETRWKDYDKGQFRPALVEPLLADRVTWRLRLPKRRKGD